MTEDIETTRAFTGFKGEVRDDIAAGKTGLKYLAAVNAPAQGQLGINSAHGLKIGGDFDKQQPSFRVGD